MLQHGRTRRPAARGTGILRRVQPSLYSGRESSAQRVTVLLLIGLFAAAMTDPSHSSFVRLPQIEAIEFSKQSRLPLLIASVYFAFVGLLSWIAINVLHYMRSLIDRWTHQIKRGLQAHFVICILASFFYMGAYRLDTQILLKIDGGSHMVMRSLHWTISTPLQWYIFSVSFAVHRKDMGKIYASAVMTQISGLFMLIFTGKMMIWLSGLVSCTAFVVMFRVVFQMPLRPETAKAAQLTQFIALFTWLAFPMVALCRAQLWISPWLEQVVLYTILDCISKGITFGSAIVLLHGCVQT
jgi:hypothetical protein